jgi:hypothetical protein
MFAVYIQGEKHTRVESVIRFIMKGAYGNLANAKIPLLHHC